MAWRREPAWICDDHHCGTITPESELLVAQHPFVPTSNIYGCPQCAEIELGRACDWYGCDRHVSCGTPTPDGYRNTCSKHRPTSTQAAMPDIRVTETYTDGHVETWTRDGQDQEGRLARLRRAGRPFRHGPGWVEWDERQGEPGLERTVRIDWLEGE